MDLIKWSLGFVGHLGLWCLIFNRIHATAWPRSSRKLSEKAILLAVAIPIAWVVVLMLVYRTIDCDALLGRRVVFGYFCMCMVVGCLFIARWAWLKLMFRLPARVIESSRVTMNVRDELGVPLLHGRFARLLGRFPLNEVLQLTVQRMTFELDVPTEVDGLKICQLSDLHFTGQIGIEYFQRVVEEANRFEPDLVFITGDLVDETECLPWLESTLGKLRSKLGVYYVLGNHDLRIKDESAYRGLLHDLGLKMVSGKWTTIPFGDTTIEITGNALPWFNDANELNDEERPESGLRILLSHSPDQLDWALSRRFELMFAGHTHGGQIAFPIIGPVIAPSKFGVRYAGGTYEVGEMLMHVSRGLSGDEPIRFCSSPELGLFTIRSSRGREDSTATPPQNG